MTLRDDVLITSGVISNSRASDDGSIVSQLVRRGYGPLQAQAELLVACAGATAPSIKAKRLPMCIRIMRWIQTPTGWAG